MAMEYARLYFDFFTSEKTQFLLDECGESGIVCLQRLWVRAGQRNNDGTFLKTGRALEKIAGWRGKPGKLIETLTDPDFIFLERVSEKEFKLHNWLENNDHLSDKAKEMRTGKARRAGLASAEKRRQEATTSQLGVNSESTASQLNPTRGQLDPTNVTKHNVTEHNITEALKPLSDEKKKLKLALEILDHFNQATGRALTLSGKTRAAILSRTEDGYTLGQFVYVIAVCYHNWHDDPKMKQHLHPSVIFNGDMDKRLLWEKNDKRTNREKLNDELKDC